MISPIKGERWLRIIIWCVIAAALFCIYAASWLLVL